LPVIVLAQFAATSLWFAGNAVLGDVQAEWGQGGDATGTLTSAVQLGFIAGTLVFAVLTIADRFPARAVFLASALVGAAANAAVAALPIGMTAFVALRFVVGFALAGIYPVGMKIAASWFRGRLGHALGLLVGALVLGTAFPHLVRAIGARLPWRALLATVSAIAALGGVALFAFVPTGPYLRAQGAFDPRALPRVFRAPELRAAALGYFGHMWELYAFWAFVPALVAYVLGARASGAEVSAWSFVVIVAGVIGCIAGGLAARRFGSARVAAVQLAASGVLCLASPLVVVAPAPVALALLVAWGVFVVGDSPQFSALVAVTAPADLVGTALAIVTSIGFAITIASIQLLDRLVPELGADRAFVALAAGPVLGLVAMRRLLTAHDPPQS
jgi:predicted MFS family arabinose efflux permease